MRMLFLEDVLSLSLENEQGRALPGTLSTARPLADRACDLHSGGFWRIHPAAIYCPTKDVDPYSKPCARKSSMITCSGQTGKPTCVADV